MSTKHLEKLELRLEDQRLALRLWDAGRGDIVDLARAPGGRLIEQTAYAVTRFLEAPTRFNWDGLRHRKVSPSLTAQEACRRFCPESGVGQGMPITPISETLTRAVVAAARQNVADLSARVETLRDEQMLLPKKDSVPDLIVA